MCIVVDTNAFSPVFNEACARHSQFVHVKNWIDRGRGFLVFGGTTFKKELERTYHYLRLVRQMKDSGRAVAIRDESVDAEEERVRALTQGTDCNDQHIIGLLSASRCPLVCSEDVRAFRYFKDRTLYPDDMDRVRIYRSSRNRALLNQPIGRERLRNRK